MHHSQIHQEPQGALPLGHHLQNLLDDDDRQSLLMGELVDAIDGKSFGLLLILLSLPSAIPIPAVGYSTPFGICIAVIAIQMLVGRNRAALPKWMRKISLPLKITRKMSQFALSFLKKTEKVIKPRLTWMHKKTGHSLLSITVLTMACLMMIPIPGTNTLPAMAIFVVGVSISEEDGLIAFAAILISLAAAISTGALFYTLLNG